MKQENKKWRQTFANIELVDAPVQNIKQYFVDKYSKFDRHFWKWNEEFSNAIANNCT